MGKPTLWYFNNLNFLDDQETPKNSQSNIQSDDDETEIEVSEATSELEAETATETPEEQKGPQASTSFNSSCDQLISHRAPRTAGASRQAKRRVVVDPNTNGAMLEHAFQL